MRRTRACSRTTYTETARTTVWSWAVAWLPGPPRAARDAASAAPRNLGFTTYKAFYKGFLVKRSEGFHLLQERLFSFFSLFSLPAILLPCFFSFFLNSAIGFSVPNNLTGYPVDCIFKICLFQLTLPDNDHDPAFSFQFSPDLLIPLLVPGDLGHPELGVGFGDRIILTVFVAMPKAAVNKDNCPILWQYDIRAAGKALVVHSVTKPLAPKGMTQFPLRCGRCGMYCCHITMALGWCMVVWHVSQRYDYSSKSTKTFILTDCRQKIITFIFS